MWLLRPLLREVRSSRKKNLCWQFFSFLRPRTGFDHAALWGLAGNMQAFTSKASNWKYVLKVFHHVKKLCINYLMTITGKCDTGIIKFTESLCYSCRILLSLEYIRQQIYCTKYQAVQNTCWKDLYRDATKSNRVQHKSKKYNMKSNSNTYITEYHAIESPK